LLIHILKYVFDKENWVLKRGASYKKEGRRRHDFTDIGDKDKLLRKVNRRTILINPGYKILSKISPNNVAEYSKNNIYRKVMKVYKG